MSNLRRRIQKLEFRFTDVSGFAPHSQPWLDYWQDKIDRFLAGEPADRIGQIPLAFIDHIVARGDAEQALKKSDELRSGATYESWPGSDAVP